MKNILIKPSWNQKFCSIRTWKFILFGLIIGFLSACAPQISFQVQRPPEFQFEDIEYLAVGSFKGDSGIIPLPPKKK